MASFQPDRRITKPKQQGKSCAFIPFLLDIKDFITELITKIRQIYSNLARAACMPKPTIPGFLKSSIR